MLMEIVKKTCPYCNNIQYMNIRSYANHVRWCTSNPCVEEKRKELSQKIHDKMMQQKTYDETCVICGQGYVVKCTEHRYSIGDYRKTCSEKCAIKLTILNTNKNKKNKNISKTLRENAEKQNKNKGVLNYCVENKSYKKTCPCCNEYFFARKKNTKFCSRKCADKYRSKEYRKNKKIKDIYRNECKFLFSLNSYPDEFDFILLKENGWYKAKNHGENPEGVSRDHMFSINEGFKKRIDPYYISHPANCQLLLHNVNIIKGTDCSISFDELKERVRAWNEKYGEYENTINYDGLKDFLNMGCVV